MNNTSNVLICGVGQLGRRYLEGILKINTKISIYIYDISSNSLEAVADLIKTCNYNENLFKIFIINNLSNLPTKFNLTIVSSTANARLDIIKLVLKNTNVEFWILEKNIAQSINDLYSIEKIISCSTNVWINTPRRIMNIYKKIKELSHKSNEENIIAKMTGGLWGMACNAVHYIDLIFFLSESKLIKIDTSELDDHWIESKRSGFWEVTGKIICHYEDKSILTLESKINNSVNFEINGNKFNWNIDEFAGVANRNDGLKIVDNLLLQSQITPMVVSSIIQNGVCELPTLKETLHYHDIFIHSMLKHWNEKMAIDANIVPIT